MSRITTFYSDKEKTNALYPITKTNAIYDNNNVNLEQRLNEALKLQMDLLWTNASPTSIFAPQTISLDLSSYKVISVIFKGHVSAANISDIYINSIINKNEYIYASIFPPNQYTRKFYFNDDGVTFYEAVYFDYGVVTTHIANELVIPYKIYGIK